ncbi:MAG TPA: hypothetical protein DDZ19_00310 [Flavobacteriales bacterium]|jgi:hypothetical protein|nr:hypothetical protein [Flavobacteriales bacterium]
MISRHFNGIWIATALSTMLFACKPDEPSPVAPEISILEVAPTTVGAYEHPIEVTLHYRDAQGDLGEADPDSASLRVRDSRLNADDWYHVPPLTPNQMELSIEGDFLVQIPPLFLLGNGDQETTTLSFQLYDRAGNASNEVTSETILILDTLR